MAMAVENWDNDADFEGDFQAYAANSVGTAPTNISSRMSVHSESMAGDDDWNVVLRPNDEQSTAQAIQSVQQAGIPIPINVPASALLGGTIKRLGKKKSRARIGDDWDHDLEMPDTGALTLKPHAQDLSTENMDDFDELEGSLGIRSAGATRDQRNRSSSVSAMSPSMGSVTAESSEDELRGLELPEGPMDFDAMLKKRRAAEAELSDLSQASPAIEQQATMNTHKKSKLSSGDTDNFFDDLDFNGADVFDMRKRNTNKNLKLRGSHPVGPTARPATTLNFHDKPTDKPTHMRSHLPRPVSGAKQSSRLEPVFETGASHLPRERRQAATSSTRLLQNKRSMPVLSSRQQAAVKGKPLAPFVPPTAINPPPQGSAAAQRAVPYHIRRESDPNNRRGAASPPPLRPNSRLSNSYTPDTPSRPSRHRGDVAPAALAREAAAKRTVTKPTRRRNFGDGSELESFDDLPTSSQKESKFVKQPIARGPPKLGLRQTQSRSDMREPNRRHFAVPERMMTPAPRTPASPTKGFYDCPSQTPSYLRDTAASRIARESRLSNNPRPRSEGPLMPLSTNWKAQVAARSPQGSPSAQRHKGKRPAPTLIKNLGGNVAKTEKGMVYNPQTMRWEGNENTLSHFEGLPVHETPTQTPTVGRPYATSIDRRGGPSTSPPRPALIAPALGAAAHGIQVNSGMVFDPRQMKWLKLREGREVSGQLSPSIADGEDDVFAGIADLADERSPALLAVGGGTAGITSSISMPGGGVDVHEEFDLGPAFIARQREEESVWRKRCDGWFPGSQPRSDDGAWRWAIRSIASEDTAIALN